MDSTFHSASKPLSPIVRAAGRKEPPKDGLFHGEERRTTVSSPRGRKPIEPPPWRPRVKEKETGPAPGRRPFAAAMISPSNSPALPLPDLNSLFAPPQDRL